MIDLTALVFLVILLQIKHWYIDFVNQTMEEVQHKGIYLDWLGVKHSLKHGIGTMLVFTILSPGYTAVALGMIDFLIHYHTDWVKTKINDYFDWDPLYTKEFWWLFGFDQLVHQLTYILLIAIVIGAL
jgi:hypothetical protein